MSIHQKNIIDNTNSTDINSRFNILNHHLFIHDSTNRDFYTKRCKLQKNDNDDEKNDKTLNLSLSLINNNKLNNTKNSRSPSPSSYHSRNYLSHQHHHQKKNNTFDTKNMAQMQLLPPPPTPPLPTGRSLQPPPPPPVINTSFNGAKQLNKLKRFLTTLQQFASDISPEINERVKNLILNLINSAITIEDFHSKLQETTNFPLRPFVIQFLKNNLPLLQRELLYFSRLSTTSTTANVYDYLIQTITPINGSDYTNDNEDDLNDDFKLNLKRNHQTGSSSNSANCNTNVNKRKSPPQIDEFNSTNQKQDLTHLTPPLTKRHHSQLTTNHHQISAYNSNYLLPPPPPLPSPIIHKSTQPPQVQPIVNSSNFSLNNANNSNSVTHSSSTNSSSHLNPPQSTTAFNNQPNMSTTTTNQQLHQQLVAPSPLNPNFNHFHPYYSVPPAPIHGTMPSSSSSSLNYLNHSAPFGHIKIEDINKWRDLRERSFTNYMRDFEQSELSEENIEDELKTIDNMSNVLGEMTQRSKRIIGILHKKSSKLRKQLDDYEIEFKRRSDESKSDRRTEERIDEIKKRADEAVNEVKRQALVEMQKANEMILREREKFEILFKETQSMEKQSDNLLDNCWNCGRKASETCGGCRQAKYCSQFCQHKNWEWIHHKQCTASKNYNKKNDSASSNQIVTTTTSNATTTTSTSTSDKKESLNLSIEIKQDLNENFNTSLTDIEKKLNNNNTKSPKSFTSSRSSSSSPNSNRNQNDDE